MNASAQTNQCRRREMCSPGNWALCLALSAHDNPPRKDSKGEGPPVVELRTSSAYHSVADHSAQRAQKDGLTPSTRAGRLRLAPERWSLIPSGKVGGGAHRQILSTATLPGTSRASFAAHGDWDHDSGEARTARPRARRMRISVRSATRFGPGGRSRPKQGAGMAREPCRGATADSGDVLT